jgi:hypothetical protein
MCEMGDLTLYPLLPISASNPGVYRLPTGNWESVASPLINDQRAVTAEILSFYSVTQTSSTGYQSALSHFTGTADEKKTKAESLLKSLFNGVYIGKSAGQYDDVRMVLSYLGVPLAPSQQGPGVQAHHENHFHAMIQPPAPKPLTGSMNLLATGEADMMDINTGPSYVQVASANIAAVAEVKQPNWMSNRYKKASDFQFYSQQINSREYPLTSYGVKYKEKGPLGIPGLIISGYEFEFSPTGDPAANRTVLELAANACYYLDVQVGRVGAWGAECKIDRFITLPKGKLTEFSEASAESNFVNFGPNTYYFDPKGIGRDTIRFILTNGEGKKVDVTYQIKIVRPPNDHGQADQNYDFVQDDAVDSVDLASWQRSGDLMNVLASASQAITGFADLPGTTVGQTTSEGANASITLDTNGHTGIQGQVSQFAKCRA